LQIGPCAYLTGTQQPRLKVEHSKKVHCFSLVFSFSFYVIQRRRTYVYRNRVVRVIKAGAYQKQHFFVSVLTIPWLDLGSPQSERREPGFFFSEYVSAAIQHMNNWSLNTMKRLIGSVTVTGSQQRQ
jgi:hypothetical protein